MKSLEKELKNQGYFISLLRQNDNFYFIQNINS